MQFPFGCPHVCVLLPVPGFSLEFSLQVLAEDGMESVRSFGMLVSHERISCPVDEKTLHRLCILADEFSLRLGESGEKERIVQTSCSFFERERDVCSIRW